MQRMSIPDPVDLWRRSLRFWDKKWRSGIARGIARPEVDALQANFPNRLLAYKDSPSFKWGKNLNAKQIETFQKTLGGLGYKFQFITLVGWPLVNYHSSSLAKEYSKDGMPAYTKSRTRSLPRRPQVTRRPSIRQRLARVSSIRLL